MIQIYEKNVHTKGLNVSFNSPKTPPLGNNTSYSANLTTKGIQPEKIKEKKLKKLKYTYVRDKANLKLKIAGLSKRVGFCGSIPIDSKKPYIQMVKGEKGGTYYAGMQRCGSVWFCQDCMYKIMKARANEIYNQLLAYKNRNQKVIFVTFTIQHNKGERLNKVKKRLLDAFDFANSSREYQSLKKKNKIEFLRVLEVLHGPNGWHPHLHCVFTGSDILNDIQVFKDLYEKKLKKLGLLVNGYTTQIDVWNENIQGMSDYLFKGMLEYELVGGNLKKSKSGLLNFFDLVRKDDIEEYIEFFKSMKGSRQYHSSRKFFADVRQKKDEDILKDDKIEDILFVIPRRIFSDIRASGIAAHLINEYNYFGDLGMIRLLKRNKIPHHWVHDSRMIIDRI